MFKEFLAFIRRGNVVDLAVAVVIGGAFGAITTSLVNDIVMPPIGLLLGNVDFTNLGVILSGDFETVAAALEAGAPVILYGKFINTLINFLIIALTIFLVVKGYNRALALRAKDAEVAEEAAPEEPPRQEVLLEEIRDLLKRQAG